MATSTDPASSKQSSAPKKSRFSRKPKDKKAKDGPGRVAQFTQVYKGAKAQDPAIGWWMLLAFVVVVGIFLLIGIAIGHPIYLTIIGVMIGVLAAMLIMGRRAERAAYRSIEGTPGATGAALGSLRRGGWRYEQEPVAAEAGRARNVKDMANAAMVFRAVGKPGVVLIGEGPKGSSAKLLESERRRIARVAGPEVPVHVLRVGKGEGTVEINTLAKTMNKLPDKLTKAEIEAVTKRLRALGAAKPPIPPGMDPRKARMDRKATRGR